MDGGRFALLIANSNYADPELRKLIAPANDAADLARVLENPDICGFQVRTLKDAPISGLNREIERFFEDRARHDLLLLYFSGHGIKDLEGQLYFAASDTELSRHRVRRSTAVSAQFVNEVMSRSRSRRQVLLLDCCHSGAFKEGMLAKGGEQVGAAEQLQGQGRIVLTASDGLQYSFEGDNVHGRGKRSIFTRTLVEGLESGQADVDRDGLFSVDDIYQYVKTRIHNENIEQKPVKMGIVEGEIFLGRNPRPIAAELPRELAESIEDRRPWVRRSAIQELGVLLSGSHKGMALAAREALLRLTEDDSREVSREAVTGLAAHEARSSRQPPLAMRPVQESEGARQLHRREGGTSEARPPYDARTHPHSPDQSPTRNIWWTLGIHQQWWQRLYTMGGIALAICILAVLVWLGHYRGTTPNTSGAQQTQTPSSGTLIKGPPVKLIQ